MQYHRERLTSRNHKTNSSRLQRSVDLNAANLEKAKRLRETYNRLLDEIKTASNDKLMDLIHEKNVVLRKLQCLTGSTNISAVVCFDKNIGHAAK